MSSAFVSCVVQTNKSNERNQELEKEKWGWISETDDCEAHGTCDSKEQALEDAKQFLEDQGLEGDIVVEVGKCKYPDPIKYLPDDIDDLLEIMDERASDDTYGFWEDEIFEVRDRHAAQEDLTKLLRKWANKHIMKAPCWTLDVMEKTKVHCKKKGRK